MIENNSCVEQVPSVLVVDDDRTMRSLLNLAMEEEGYRVVEAKNGAQCLAEYAHFQPDLILLDAVMPDLDGFDCCQKIRNLPGGDRVTILMITVLNDRESIEQAFAAGATDYITKPINWSVLSQRVRRFLAADRAWLKIKALKEQLDRQRVWQETNRKVLQQLSQGERLNESVESALTTIRTWLQASRVLLYQTKTQTWIESVAPEYPSVKEFSETDFNLSTELGEQYLQEKIFVIGNIAEANFPPTVVGWLQKLNTQAVSLVPLWSGTQIIGLLSLHAGETCPQWQKLDTDKFSDLGRLIAMKIE